jgi:hypothetical protein
MAEQPVFRVISPDTTPEELAAITAALEVVQRERSEAAARASGAYTEHVDEWVRVSRLTSRRAGMLRGPWRLSGRVSRRARA